MEEEKIKLWKQRIVNHKNSGLSVSEWCKQQKIHTSRYYYWRDKLEKENSIDDKCIIADVTPILIEDECDVNKTNISETSILKENKEKTTSCMINIKINEVAVSISNKKEAELAAIFINQLRKLC